MTKKKFLSELEKKLSVLNESEIKDIVNEYSDIIDEKVKHGKTEKEAIEDFGKLDDLAKEILSAYKINPDYEDKEETVIDKGEDLIKRCASKIADWSSEAANRFKASNKEIGLELIFEIVIKIFIALILLLVFRGIFHAFSNLGFSLFSDFFSPVGEILGVVWQVFLTIIYIFVCILLIVSMFKKYFSKVSTEDIKDEPIVETDKTKEAKQSNSTKKVEPKVKKNKQKKSGTSLGDICLLIVKVLVIIYVIIPFIILDCIFIIGLVFSVIYWIKGIDLLGLTLGLAGLVLLFTYLIKLIFSLLFGKSKPHVFPVIISLIMMGVGGFLFADMIMSINYYDEAPTTGIKQEVEEKQFTTDKKVFINTNYHYNDSEKIVDNGYQDGKFILRVTYNQDYMNLEFTQRDNHQFNKHCEYDYDGENYYDYEDEYEDYQRCNDESVYNYIEVDYESYNDFNNFKKVYNNLIENLKDKKVYDYSKLYGIKIEVVANEKTMNMIELR